MNARSIVVLALILALLGAGLWYRRTFRDDARVMTSESLRPMVPVIWPCFSICPSASRCVVTALRTSDCSNGVMGSTLRANPICTGPRTWPQLTLVPHHMVCRKLSL